MYSKKTIVIIVDLINLLRQIKDETWNCSNPIWEKGGNLKFHKILTSSTQVLWCKPPKKTTTDVVVVLREKGLYTVRRASLNNQPV